METAKAILYEYDEAKEKISELFSKIENAPTADECDAILKRNRNTRAILFILSFFSVILLIVVCVSIHINNITNHIECKSMYHIILLILTISIIFLLISFSTICESNWIWVVKLQDKEYYKKYQHVGLFYSKTDYAKNILHIVKNTDIYMYETEKCQKQPYM